MSRWASQSCSGWCFSPAPLAGDAKAVDRGAGAIEDLGRQRAAGDDELTIAVALAGLHDVRVAGRRRVERRAASADGQVLDAANAGASVVVIVPAKDDGDPVLLEQRLQVPLDSAIVAVPAAGRPAGLVQD